MKEMGVLPSICKPGFCFQRQHRNILGSAEDAAGPTATCQITTYEPEPQLDLPFDNEAV
jgi:hypothetical protein